MIRRVLFGLLWCVVFYFVACFLTGAIAGGIAGSKDPANASAAGARAGAEAVLALRIYLLAGAILLSAAGAWAGVLPGTRQRKPPDHSA